MAAKRRWRLIGFIAMAAGVIALIAFALVFQDSIFRFAATPRAPFQTVAAPAAPDYADPAAWLARPAEGAAAEKPADLFYIHATTFYRRKLWNAPIDDPLAMREQEMVALPNEAGPFNVAAEIYAPRYREATLFSLFTHKYDGLAARRLAYEDVKRAFDAFIASRDPERPLIIAGYGQGGLYAVGLLRDYFQGEINPLRRRLVAAYVIGFPMAETSLSGLAPPVPVCEGPDAVRCVISWNDFEPRFDEEMERIRARALVWTATRDLSSLAGEKLVCVNPLSWKKDGAYAGPEANIGAASATGLSPGAAPPPIAGAVGAKCENGVLIVDTPKMRALRRGDWFGAKWKPQPFNLFYYDIAENIAVRIETLKNRLRTEPEPLAPIGEIVDVVDSPVNKVPD